MRLEGVLSQAAQAPTYVQAPIPEPKQPRDYIGELQQVRNISQFIRNSSTHDGAEYLRLRVNPGEEVATADGGRSIPDPTAETSANYTVGGAAASSSNQEQPPINQLQNTEPERQATGPLSEPTLAQHYQQLTAENTCIT